MRAVIAISVVVCLVCVCDAQNFGWGRCPKPSTKENFDLDQYLGRWYEVLRYPFVIFERNLRCVTAEYSLIPEESGSVKVLNSGTSTSRRTEGERESSVGKAVVVDPAEPAKLRVSFGESWLESDAPNYWVVDTDYTTYSIVYSCSEFLFFRFDILWVLGREKEFDDELRRTLIEKVEEQGINTRNIEDQDQSCPDEAYEIPDEEQIRD